MLHIFCFACSAPEGDEVMKLCIDSAITSIDLDLSLETQVPIVHAGQSIKQKVIAVSWEESAPPFCIVDEASVAINSEVANCLVRCKSRHSYLTEQRIGTSLPADLSRRNHPSPQSLPESRVSIPK